jgi:SAM-dependent methyltransferase
MIPLSFVCPDHRDTLLHKMDNGDYHCKICARIFPTRPVLDLMDRPPDGIQTADHYTLQWGRPLGFIDFLAENKQAEKVTMGKRLAWPRLFDRMRHEAESKTITVYDAACGRGAIFFDLFADPVPAGMRYVGADIHGSLTDIRRPNGVEVDWADFLRWDVSYPLPVRDKFDYVICRASVMITPDPAFTMKSLSQAAKRGGHVAVSLYTKKAPMREASDDALREIVVPLSRDEGFEVCRQFAKLGRDLQNVEAKVAITEDLPFLQIPKGEYQVQEFVYDFLFKCWYNKLFGIDHSAAVNFDWYHPEFTYRYTLEEVIGMCEDAGLKILETESDKYQHYVEAEKQ